MLLRSPNLVGVAYDLVRHDVANSVCRRRVITVVFQLVPGQALDAASDAARGLLAADGVVEVRVEGFGPVVAAVGAQIWHCACCFKLGQVIGKLKNENSGFGK